MNWTKKNFQIFSKILKRDEISAKVARNLLTLESGINVVGRLLILEKNSTQHMFIPTIPFITDAFLRKIKI